MFREVIWEEKNFSVSENVRQKNFFSCNTENPEKKSQF